MRKIENGGVFFRGNGVLGKVSGALVRAEIAKRQGAKHLLPARLAMPGRIGRQSA